MYSREEDPEVESSLPPKKKRREDILRNQKEFNRVYRKGKSVGDRYVVVFCLKNHLGYNRISYLASKKVGNSVQRNRARRLMKEAMRLSSMELPVGYDFVVIARNTIGDAKCQQVQKSLESAFRRTGVLKK